jgi:hypothetical protein
MNGVTVKWMNDNTDLSNISMYRGDSYPLEFVLVNTSTSDPIDLTGAVLELTVNSEKAPIDNSNEKMKLMGTLGDVTLGQVSFTPTTTDTNQVAGRYYFDIQMVHGGNVRTIHLDSFTITQDINKD